LNYAQDWLALAQQASWSVSQMAKLCAISVRTLERYFIKTKGKTPKVWLAEQRQHRAMVLLQNGSTVKETAACLGYNHAGNFSRKFRKHWGSYPVAMKLHTKPVTAVIVVK